jgi:hypothetical protein
MSQCLAASKKQLSFAIFYLHLSQKVRMKKFIFNIIESIPLTIFLVYVQTAHITVRHDWLAPYLLASSAGIISSAYLFRQDVVLNRICIAINLYFLSGVLGLISEWNWLNQWYGQLRGLGMLYWILLVGSISIVVSPYGFIGIKQPATKYWSIGLLAVSGIATAMAICFSDYTFWGEWFPFIFLFSMRGVLQNLSRKTKN